MEIALFSLVGIFTGAALQYVFTRVLEERRHIRELRTSAYTDYLRCVSDMKHRFIQPQATREREMLADLADAKTRVALYGTNVVVRCLGEFEQLGGQIRGSDPEQAFIRLVEAMRNEKGAAEKDLAAIVLGPENEVA